MFVRPVSDSSGWRTPQHGPFVAAIDRQVEVSAASDQVTDQSLDAPPAVEPHVDAGRRQTLDDRDDIIPAGTRQFIVCCAARDTANLPGAN